MLKWIARQAQVTALERQILDLTARLATVHERLDTDAARIATLTDQVTNLNARTEQHGGRLDDTAERMACNEDRIARVDSERSGTADYLDRMIVHYDGQIEETKRLSNALLRLTHRFDLHAEDTTRVAAALLDRIERTRALSDR